jgi:uroporphyrinogen-III synthase
MRIFFSSTIDASHPLAIATKTLCLELHAVSLLSFEALPAHPKHPYEIIFFSSPRAYTFGKPFISTSIKVACFASGTGKYIVEPIDWEGKTPGNPKRTAQEFLEWAGNRRVLFPVSDRSLGTIPAAFPSEQVECLTVYKTILSPQPIAPCDVYVFTSPSNVEAFLSKNILPKHAKLIAWGESTRAYLESLNHSIAYHRSHEAPIDWIALLTPWINP